MAITYEKFGYYSERYKNLEKLHQQLKEATALDDAVLMAFYTDKIVFESSFFASFMSDLLAQVHITRYKL